MKKMLAVLLSILMILSSAYVFADETQNEICVSLNGMPISFDVPPQIISDRTMVPFRGIFEALGGEVGFDEATSKVSCKQDESMLTFTIGSREATLETAEKTETISMDVAPVIVDGRTVVPVRFVAESTGLKVGWDSLTRDVIIVDTDAWRTQVEAEAEFLDIMLKNPVLNMVKMTADSEVNMEYTLSINSADPTIPVEKLDLSFNISALDKTESDGKALSEKTALTIDLTSFNEIMTMFEEGAVPEATSEIIENLFKKHIINLDIIIDDNLNIYIKAPELLALIDSFAGTAFSEVVGDKYLLLPVAKLLKEAGISFDTSTTIWDMLDALIYSADDALGLNAIVMIDSIVDLCCNMVGNETVTKEAKEDGSVVYNMKITTQDYIPMVTAYINAISSAFGIEVTEEMLNMYKNMEYNADASFTVKDGIITKSEAAYNQSMKDVNIDSFGSTLGMTAKMTTKSTVKLGNDNVITIPSDVINILN